MKNVIGFVTVLLLTNVCFAQDYQAEFESYRQQGDSIKQKEVLVKWEKKDPKNAELFTSYFNYYFLKSKQEFISLTTNQPKGKSFQFQDSTGLTAGFLGSQILYDKEILQKGIDKIDEGIKLYPNRLDMRFGKIHVYGQTEDWENFTNEIINTVKYSAINNNSWTWTNNEPVVDGKKIMLSSIQDYQLQLYNTEDDDLLKNMQAIANEILNIYPNHIESLSNISITYLLTGDFENGIETLLRAEKIAPKDIVILANIAHGYKLSKNKEKSIEYYKKVIEHGDDQEKNFAKQQINLLKK
jgi:tetratricopeptide (TPR) repeat protein